MTSGDADSATVDRQLIRAIEALLFIANDPVSGRELALACEVEVEQVDAALAVLREQYLPGLRGLELRELAGGFTFATAADTDRFAQRLLARPRLRSPALTSAQAETLAIVAYLQPVSRPEISQIRGVSGDSASGTLLERGLIEECGRSQHGALLLRTTPLFLKLFGLASLKELPELKDWDPTDAEREDLRERLIKAGQARMPIAATQAGSAADDRTAADAGSK